MQIADGAYAAVILKSQQQSGKNQEGKEWQRIRLWVDICCGIYKSYFTNLKSEYKKDKYMGIVDWYIATDGAEYTPTQLIQAQNNISVICAVNGIETLPAKLEGKIVGITIKHDNIGCVTVSGWLTANVDYTYADTDITHYYNPDAYATPTTTKLSDTLTPTVVKPKNIKPYGDIAARRQARQAATNNPVAASPSPAPPPPTTYNKDMDAALRSIGGLTDEEIQHICTQPAYNSDYKARVHQLLIDANATHPNATSEQIEQYRIGCNVQEKIGDVLREIETEANKEKIRWVATVVGCVRWW